MANIGVLLDNTGVLFDTQRTQLVHILLLHCYEKVLVFMVCCDIHAYMYMMHVHIFHMNVGSIKKTCLKLTFNLPPFNIPCAQVESHFLRLPELPNFITVMHVHVLSILVTIQFQLKFFAALYW